MTPAPSLAQYEAIICVGPVDVLRCDRVRDHDGDHEHQAGYKTPGVKWHSPRWISMGTP